MIHQHDRSLTPLVVHTVFLKGSSADGQQRSTFLDWLRTRLGSRCIIHSFRSRYLWVVAMSKLTMETELIEGEWYFIQGSVGIVAAQHIKTKGNDYEYPTFEVPLMHANGYRISVTRADVIGRIQLVTDD